MYLAFVFRIGLFMDAMLPLLIENLRNGTATNKNNLILALAGLVSLGVGHLPGWNQQPFRESIEWIGMGILVLFLVSFLIQIPAGIATTRMAFLPWFTMDGYLVLVAFALTSSGIVGWLTKRDIRIALPLVVVSLGLWICEFSFPVPA